MRNICFSRLGLRARFGLIATVSILLIGVPASPLQAAGSGWSGSTAISPAGQPDPTRGSQLNDVAVNLNGLTIAAWDQYTYNNGGGATIGAAVQSGGRWAVPFTISGTTGYSMSPRVAVGADGTMAVAWTYQDPMTIANPQQKIQVAVKPAGATNWTTTVLAQGTVGGVAITPPVPVAVDASGNVTAAWTLWNGTRHVVQVATFQSGAWSISPPISGTDDGLYLSLSINTRGDAAVAYTISPYASYGTLTSAKYVFRGGLTGSWTAPVVVSEQLSSSVGYVTNPIVALDDFGLATVAYFAYGVEAVRQLSDATWTSPQTVLRAPNSVSSYGSIDLGMDKTGNSVIAASIFDATVGVDRSSVYVTVGTPQGTWLPQQRLTDPSVPVDAYATQVAMSPDGSLALVGWIDHYHGTVQVSKLSNGNWGAANTIGRGTAFSSFQEVLGLDASSNSVSGGVARARAIWKNTKSGTQIYASSYN